MIVCQSRPLELSRTVRVLLADRPQFRHSEHSERQRLWTNLKFEGRTVRTPHRATHQKRKRLWTKNELACGPSAPQGRTVRSSLFSPNQRNNLSGTNLRLACGPSSSHGRTVRRSTLNPTREIPFLVQL